MRNKDSSSTTLVSVGPAAVRLGVSRPTLIAYIERGAFPAAFQLPSGHWRIPLWQVEALLPSTIQDPAEQATGEDAK